MRKRNVWLDWIFGALLTAAMFVCLKFITNFRFENSDDIVMVKAFMGFEGGAPADFSLYLHTLLAWALYGISLIAPGIPWFSLFQLGLLFFSCTVIAKSFFQLAENTRRPFITGALASVLFLAAFAAFACCRINFTTTATLAGTAAIAQTMTVDFSSAETKPRVRAVLLAILLLTASYCLRVLAALPSALFIGGVLLWKLLPQDGGAKRGSVPWRPVLKTALAFLVVLLSLFAARQAEIGLRGLRDYMNWNDANGALLDYTDFETNAAPAIHSDSGLTISEITLVQQWYFLSSDIDEQALWTMANAYDGAGRNGGTVLASFFAENTRYPYLAAVVILLCGLSLIRLRRDAWAAPLLSLASLLATAFLLFYLAQRGRLLSRAVDSVLIPCAAFNLGLALHGWCGDVRNGLQRAAAVALAALTAAAALGSARLTYQTFTLAEDYVSPQREADLEAYALLNPDLLIVRTPNLLRDTRLLPDVSNGIPENTIFWGDWLCRTPNWNRQLAQYGFDADSFTAADWLKSNIVFAALSQEDTADLCAYLTEATGTAVAAEETGVYGTLRFYRFEIVE